MGRQGGIARFTGSFGDLNFYFDDDRATVRWKSRFNAKKWRKRKEMWRQHACAHRFGAASVVACHLWRGMPPGMKRLADGAGYGRLVGSCLPLIEEDGQLWDADLLAGVNLNLDAMGSTRFRVKGNGFQLCGLDRLREELDAALGDWAGDKPASFLVAQGVGCHGLQVRGMKLTAEEAQARVAFGKGPGTRGLGPGAARVRRAERRYRVWVHASRVVDTLWNAGQGYFTLDTWHGPVGGGYVTEWATDFPAQLHLRHPVRGVSAFSDGQEVADGDYVVFLALEVAEKRKRHWVRLPWCCRFMVVGCEERAARGELRVVGAGSGRRIGERGAVRGGRRAGRRDWRRDWRDWSRDASRLYVRRDGRRDGDYGRRGGDYWSRGSDYGSRDADYWSRGSDYRSRDASRLYDLGDGDWFGRAGP